MAITSCEDEIKAGSRRLPRLLKQLNIDPASIALAVKGLTDFPFKAPPSFIQRMGSGDPADPLLRQVLPLAEEDQALPGFSADPLGEVSREAVPGVLHKYHGRALLITTGVCAIHCRYCFRRHFPYQAREATQQTWQPALDYLAEDPSIHEVILSGGDPLSLADGKLAGLLQSLADISHLKSLRIHSRIPVVQPERITPTLLQMLLNSRLQPIMVIHCNHPNEINNEAGAALAAMHQSGITLLNQSVLLRGVNDDLGVLTTLSEKLFEHRVLPYYLHLLDPVDGAAHFDVPEAEALRIMHELSSRLPGYLVPRLVREQPGAPYKIIKGAGVI